MTSSAIESFKCIAIIGNHHQESYIPQIARLIRGLQSSGFDVVVEVNFLKWLNDNGSSSMNDLKSTSSDNEEVDLVISIGGDGTFLQTAAWVGDSGKPIIGVNTGHLGYLTAYSLQDLTLLITDIKQNRISVENRALLHVEGDELPDDVWCYALNEVAILKAETSSMIDIRTTVNGRYLTNYMADGLIISTATGSTGYNLSVGGPILQPSMDSIVLTPVAPHTLTMRPIVVGESTIINTATTSRAPNYRVSLDGRSFTMRCGTSLQVSRASFDVRVAMRSDSDFAATLRHKLLWGHR